MIELRGKYANANIYAKVIEQEAINQIQAVIDNKLSEDCKISIMPDTHAGAGCTIGTTMTINKRVCPNLVGVDIGCGMYVVKLPIKRNEINFSEFDNYIRTHIPCGREIRHARIAKLDDLKNLICYRELKDTVKFEKALATLGGGNHFMELDVDSDDNVYFVVHTGSRNLGKQVAEYYQKLADGLCNRNLDAYFIEKTNLIEAYKAEGRKTEIQKALIELKNKYSKREDIVPKDLSYLEGSHLEDYLHDIKICQEYSHLNRETICQLICKYFNVNLENCEHFETIHNYIDIEHMILRKGAISLQNGEKALIPINMRDGSLIVVGKGNPDYNFSGPHGSGRLMSRARAKENISLNDFEESMEGIFTTCVSKETLDESPMAYKSFDDIRENIEETADILEIIKPIYNFKASE